MRPGGGGAQALNVNFGHPCYLGNYGTRTRKLNLKIPLDMVKYPFWVQKIITLNDT